MARPLRHFEPGTLYFITNRTFQGRFLLRSSKSTNNIIGGVLGRALSIYDVSLYDYCFMSNHYHMIVSAKSPHLIPLFIGYLQNQISKKLGPQIGWREKMWQRRYDAAPILDNDAIDQRRRYIMAHGVKENLVDRAQQWPGLTSISKLAYNVDKTYPWYDATTAYEARVRGERRPQRDFILQYSISLTPLPHWRNLGAQNTQAKVRCILKEINQEYRKQRAAKRIQPVGVNFILAQDPLHRPSVCKRGKRPIAHSSSYKALLTFKEHYEDCLRSYREAVEKLRQGASHAVFPEFMFPPTVHFSWAQ